MSEIASAVGFLSRLPISRLAMAQPNNAIGLLARSLRWAPLAGVLIAIVPAAILEAGGLARLPGLVAAALAVASLCLVTGGLHEDGLADVADGFGGGATRERKLEIMRDSRIGTFGALALMCAVLVRVACLDAIYARWGAGSSAFALIAAASLSRALMLIPMVVLPSARRDGLAHAAGAPTVTSLVVAVALGSAFAGVAGLAGNLSVTKLLVGLLIGLGASLGVTRLARRQIGGVTGDVVGATQQIGEVAVLIVLSAGSGTL